MNGQNRPLVKPKRKMVSFFLLVSYSNVKIWQSYSTRILLITWKVWIYDIIHSRKS
jgi:hypothetical protein